MRVSYSALSSFNQCPLKYKWQYIDRIKVPTTPDLFFGSLVHSVLEFALKSGTLLPLEKSLEYYKNNWKSGVYSSNSSEKPALSTPEGFQNSSQPINKLDSNNNLEHEAFESGIEMIKNFYLSYKPTEVQILSTEKFFEIYWGEHKIVGKIDSIDKLSTGEIEIIDYKTNKKLPRDDDFKYDYQLPLYAWAAQTMFCNNVSLRGAYPDSATRQSQNDSQDSQNNIRREYNNISACPPIKLTFYYLRFNKQIDPPNAKTLEELQAYILDTIYKIQASSFEPQISALCGWCEYIHMCPEGQQYLSNKATPTSSHSEVIKTSEESITHSSNDSEKFKNSSQPIASNNKRRSKIIISSDQQNLF